MLCHKGIYIKTQDQTVPCGQCMPCRINAGRIWSSRIIQEWVTHGYGYFFTFTYAPDQLPLVLDEDGAPLGNLNKKPFLKWVNHTQEAIPFRYYAIGEYGNDTHRPHYHMAIFPREPTLIGEIRNSWKLGFTSIYELNNQRARYLANYTAKKLTKPTDYRLARSQEPEFRTSSRNPPLGAAFADAIVTRYQHPKMQKILAERGDIERTFRIENRLYPLGDYALTRIRKSLDIPLLHWERQVANDNYESWHNTQEALWEPKLAHAQETKINGQINSKRYRSTYLKV